MPTPNPPRIEFLRGLLPDEFTETQIQAEEAQLLRYIALVERIAMRLSSQSQTDNSPRRDSTLSKKDSTL